MRKEEKKGVRQDEEEVCVFCESKMDDNIIPDSIDFKCCDDCLHKHYYWSHKKQAWFVKSRDFDAIFQAFKQEKKEEKEN